MASAITSPPSTSHNVPEVKPEPSSEAPAETPAAEAAAEAPAEAVAEAAPETVEYVPASQATHNEWLVAEVNTEYVPGEQA